MGHCLLTKTIKSLKYRHVSTFLLFLFFAINGFSQAKEDNDRPSPKKVEKNNSFDPDNLVLGGSFGLQFGTITIVDISPTIGYLFTENWLVGVGARYLYYEERFNGFTFKSSFYGGGAFSQYFFFENFLAHVEQEFLSIEDFENFGERRIVSSTFVGGGYRSLIGGNSFISLLLLYNLNDSRFSPYTNPVLRVNFGIGL